MTTTRALVLQEAADKGWEAVQIDGIPEGFAWQAPDVTIGGTLHPGRYYAFIPLSLWGSMDSRVSAIDEQTLLVNYKKIKRVK